jgi:hypothetical protein
MLPSRTDIKANIMATGTNGLFERVDAFEIDQIAYVNPEVDFVAEIELNLKWLDGEAARTSRNMELLNLGSSGGVENDEEVFPREVSWLVYVWRDYLFCSERGCRSVNRRAIMTHL